MIAPDRRFLLAGFAAAGMLRALPGLAASKPGPGLHFGPAHAFSFQGLRAQAKALAAMPYQAVEPPAAAINSTEGIEFRVV